MASAKDKDGKPVRKPRRALYLAVALVVALIALAVTLWPDIRGNAQLGASYGARIACSCRYVAGRELDDCRKDFEPGMGVVSVEEDPPNERVIASVPLLAEAAAERRGDYGCVLLTDEELDAID